MGALSGLRVVELAGFGPGPMAGMMLADHGADVVRIERAGAHDHGFEIETRYFVYNRGKRSLALDLKQPEAIEILLDLIDRADVVIEGFRPGVAERLGFGPEDCLARNPRLIYGRITGYGQDGPLAQRAGHDLNYTALAGVIDLIGPADGPPVMPLNLVSDFGGGGMYIAFGILAALHERTSSNRGQVIDAAMVEGCLSLLSSTFGYLASGFHSLDRGTNLLDGGIPYYGIFQTRDGGHISIGALEPQFFARLVDILELDAAWIEGRKDKARWPELKKLLEEKFSSLDRSEWEAKLGGIDVCFAPVLSPLEAARHDHFLARNSTVEVDGVLQPSPVPRFDRSPAGPVRPVAAKGADSAAIIGELGYSADRIVALRARGAFADG